MKNSLLVAVALLSESLQEGRLRTVVNPILTR